VCDARTETLAVMREEASGSPTSLMLSPHGKWKQRSGARELAILAMWGPTAETCALGMRQVE
jgi:hypothetical protein